VASLKIIIYDHYIFMVQATGETYNPFIGLKVADIKPKKIHILKNFGNLCLLVLQQLYKLFAK